MEAQKNITEMSVSEKARFASSMGEQVGKTINSALKRCNKILNKYGYSLTVTMNFHELEKKD